MYTASELKNKLDAVGMCDGLDDWIGQYLFKRFCDSGGEQVSVESSLIGHGTPRNWSQKAFLAAMRSRGFTIEWYCEDRPCGLCWYKISLP